MLRTLLPLLVITSGCWVDASGPKPPVPGPCNNNGSCEFSQGEDSVYCAADCPPCQAVEVHVNGAPDPKAQVALLKPNDSKAISLSSGTTIQIQIGQAVYQGTDTTTDFSLQGTVTSSSTVVLTSDNCVFTPPKQGGFLVQVSRDGSVGSYSEVGYWAKTVQGGPGGSAAADVSTFSLCGFGGTARYIQIISQAGASGTLDYFKAHSCDP